MKNILVTGGAGFIGSNLVDRLLVEKKWNVTVIDNFNDFYSPFIKHENIKRQLSDPLYSLASGDILSEQLLDRVFSTARFDCIVHLAARAGVRPSLNNPRLYEETNIRGTLNLLECARKFGVKQFVFGSSSSVYGNNCQVPFSEKAQVDQPISPYAMTKATGELLCHTYSHLYGLRCLCLRFFTVYGPRQRPDLAIHKFARLISSGKTVPVYGDGRTLRDYTYIDDIISGIRSAIDYERSDFEIFNLGESQTVELNYLVELLEGALKKKAKVKNLPMQPGDVYRTYADISKAGKLLGYDPQTPIEEGIVRFVNWFKEKKSLKKAKLRKRRKFSAPVAHLKDAPVKPRKVSL